MPSFQKYNQRCVQVAPGCRDSVMGDISGWQGRVIRRFTVGTVVYLDLELLAATLERITADQRREFFKGNVCFTRVRVKESAVQDIESTDDKAQRSKLQARIQHEWYELVGQNQDDPTKRASDELYSQLRDPSKRRTMQTMIAVGIGAVALAFTAARCDNGCGYAGGGSSWGRVGGGYYG